jgi:hypothetical protein
MLRSVIGSEPPHVGASCNSATDELISRRLYPETTQASISPLADLMILQSYSSGGSGRKEALNLSV